MTTATSDEAVGTLPTSEAMENSVDSRDEAETKETATENGGEEEQTASTSSEALGATSLTIIAENEEDMSGEVSEQAMTIAPDSPATNRATSSTLLGGLGNGTSSIRDMLCAAPDTVEISDDIDEAQRAFMDMFSRKNKEEVDDGTLDEIAADSDLSNPERRIWVVTTAALPWRTGTAVNPLLRALYLTRGRPKHHVTLVIPWLDDVASRIKLYGAQNSFAAGGQKEQEEWIRRYCRERAHCHEEEQNMDILFYSAVFFRDFGSVFPTIDICSLIPDNEADVAILDEPEHLNWFRAPPPDDEQMQTVAEELQSEGDDGSDSETKDDGIAKQMKREKAEYGWAFKFRWVVGILHTNYSAYMNQYAIGTSIIAAPAIGMLSSIVVRAYCNQVVRLSAVLPTLAPHKEVTCNVHGVRSEFLLPPMPERVVTTVIEEDDDDEMIEESQGSIYFIGKVMWAKGFDKVLEIEDHFRTANGYYFPIDIYGAGPDEKEIKRAFFGRSGKPRKKSTAIPIEPSLSEEDVHAAEIFAAEESLREQVGPVQVETSIEVFPDEKSPTGDSVHVEESPDCSLQDIESADTIMSEHDIVESPSNEEVKNNNPLSVIGDLSTNSVATAKATSQAVYSLVDSIVKGGMKMTLSWEKTKSEEASVTEGEEKKSESTRFFIDPPKTTYEWRRNPIPARFLGVKDHAELRDMTEYKIFLNASVTEVLCTTTAEALSMEKFAIIPKHVSNEFFFQFPNCLTFESPAECVEKLEWALVNTPTPLSDEDRHKFTWDAATARLITSSGVTKREMRERERNGTNKADARIAWFHFESGRTGQRIGRFFRRQSSVLSGTKSEDASGSSETK